MRLLSGAVLGIAAGLPGLGGPAAAQYAERPDLAGSGSPAVDVSGRSVKNMRVRAVHARDAALEGTTAWLFERDPWLAYQLGRNLTFREFRARDGLFDARVAELGETLADGSTATMTLKNATSCLSCHSSPQGNPGGGQNLSKSGGRGRNAPHFYGAGLVEMLGLQLRTKVLLAVDANGNGWVSAAEGAAAGRVRIVPIEGAGAIDYGDAALSEGRTGTPGLDEVFRVFYVDGAGRPVAGATRVDDRTTFGYSLEVVVWGWGEGPALSGRAATNRAFFLDAAHDHLGLEAYDPTTTHDPDGNGVSEPSLAGAVQFPVTLAPPDAGVELDPLGFSRDDPDGDGFLNELSEGDLDLAEWYMLNVPRPRFFGYRADYERGVEVMRGMRCLECHVPDWQIHARDEVFEGDRRFFDLEVVWDAGALPQVYPFFKADLRRLTRRAGEREVRAFGGATVGGFFSDLRHHDMGTDGLNGGYHETQFDGTLSTVWRTPPLWGMGSTFPWGHDGKSLTLEDAILRHGGDALPSRLRWQMASSAERRDVLFMLERLQLYDAETMLTDLDGDGALSDGFVVAGVDTGLERFNPEWLFKTPVRIQGLVRGPSGGELRSFAAQNLVAAYGMDLAFRRDRDADGWPDAWDHAPLRTGYRDGVE